MNAKQKIHQLKLNQWAARFQEQASSGLTAKARCEQNDFTIHTYNYWKHLLKQEYVDSILPDIVPLTDCLTNPISNPPAPSNHHVLSASHSSSDSLCFVNRKSYPLICFFTTGFFSIHL